MKKTGDKGEDLATEYLRGKGYTIVERNWRGITGFRAPEIDIIARHNNILIFIEVKAVTNTKFGQPQYKITLAKQRRIADGARAYLAINDITDCECRFDAILIDLGIQPPEINHLENAFMLPDADID